MANLRVEFYDLNTLHSQSGSLAARAGMPVQVNTIAVTGSATSGGFQPVAPVGHSTMIVALIADTSPVYVAIGTNPDPTLQGAILVLPGAPVTVVAQAGQTVSAVLANTGTPSSAYAASTTMTASTTYPAGRAVGMACTTAGTLVLTLAGSGTVSVPVAVGWNKFDFAAVSFTLANSAAGSVYNLN